MIVDDSPTARRILSDIVNRGPGMSVSASVSDPYEAVAQLKRQSPDVMILDVQMPRMDGVTFLSKLMRQHPLPVIMCSSMTAEGSAVSMQCLEMGAVDIIAKPKAATRRDIQELETRIHDVVRSAAHARLKGRDGGSLAASPARAGAPPPAPSWQAKHSADAVLDPPQPHRLVAPPASADTLVAMGASTGGTDALKAALEKLPADFPGIAIVQHMPEHFTRSFASRLNEACALTVREATDGETLARGLVLVAPGSHHMLARRTGSRYYVELREGPLVSRHRPSVDVLFRSVAIAAGPKGIGVILTGMGDDGAAGMLEMRQAGAYNVAQNRETCVVYGMPNEAEKRGGVCDALALDRIASRLVARAATA